MTQKELVRQSKAGNLDCFEELISVHQQKVYNMALRMLGNEQDALDISQEVFIKVYKSLSSFQETASFSTWVYRIATNSCLDFLRKNKERKKDLSLDAQMVFEDGEVSLQLEDQTADVEKSLLQKERMQVLYEAIDHLRDEHKKMIVLRELQGLSYQEIADITGMNLGTVKSKMNRARLALKNALEKYRELF